MASGEYIHGYTPAEQARLVEQADFWRERLILPGLAYRPGEALLDVGCGVGAVLGVIGRAFPGVALAGIDREAAQIGRARAHLTHLGLEADLRQGDAARLPWPAGAFDHVYMMWFVEHVADPGPFLREAHRVLRPGGTITINETDYSTLIVYPPSDAIERLALAQRDLFRKNGNAMAGRMLGLSLAEAGFTEVRSAPIGFHAFTPGQGDRLRIFVAYMLGFLEPMVPVLASELGREAAPLEAGIAALRALPDLPRASFTQIVFRAEARS